MHVRYWAVALLLTGASLLVVGCGPKSVSGTYIAKFTNGVEMLQLVETPDHHVTGQLQGVDFDKNGKLENISFSVTGAVDGSNISLTFKPTFFLSENITEAGTFDGAKITLTGKLANPQPSAVVFERSSAEEFETLAKAVNDRSQQLLAAKAEAEARRRQAQAEARAQEEAARKEREIVAGLSALVQRMERFDTAASVVVAKVPGVEQHYQAITAQMNKYLEQERSLSGNPNAAVARGQIDITINQGTIATEQLHNNVQPSQWDFENNAQPLMRQVSTAEKACQADDGTLNGDQPQARRDACGKLLEAVPHFKQQYEALARSFTHLEDVYKQERATQQQLVSEADHTE